MSIYYSDRRPCAVAKPETRGTASCGENHTWPCGWKFEPRPANFGGTFIQTMTQVINPAECPQCGGKALRLKPKRKS